MSWTPGWRRRLVRLISYTARFGGSDHPNHLRSSNMSFREEGGLTERSHMRSKAQAISRRDEYHPQPAPYRPIPPVPDRRHQPDPRILAQATIVCTRLARDQVTVGD